MKCVVCQHPMHLHDDTSCKACDCTGYTVEEA